MPGFPHLFCIYGPNTNLGGSSILTMMEAQAQYVAAVAVEVGRRRAGRERVLLDVRHDVARGWEEEVQERLSGSAWTGCDSWYIENGRVTTNWPGTVAEYQRRLGEVDWTELETLGPPPG